MVHFGTSGWRGVIGREVTFRKVRMVTRAILDVVREEKGRAGLLVVGYDTRMLSEKFAQTASQLAAAEDFEVRLTMRDAPSPVIAAAVLDLGADAGIIFTGSHNAPEYNGLKYYTAQGILAPKQLTDRVEARYAELARDDTDTFFPQPQLVEIFDPKPAYLSRLQDLINWEAIRRSGLKVVVDPLYGTTREYLDHILLENEIPTTVIHNTRDPYFGGYAPDCTSENLSRLRDTMRRTGADLGLSTDGDGDRFGLLDVGARMNDSSQSLALILDYLARHRGFKGGVGRSVATSCLIDAVCREHRLDMVEMPVGFKAFGPLLVDGSIEYAGEESAGLAWSAHLPERDGILACLLTAEMVAVDAMTLHELNHDLARRVGTYAFRRTQLPLSERSLQLLEKRQTQEWTTIEGRRVVDVNRTDGLKLIFENGSWILVRLAGTEPKIRLYAEGRSYEEMRHHMHLARRLLTDRRL